MVVPKIVMKLLLILKFKYVDHARACILVYTGMHKSQLSQNSYVSLVNTYTSVCQPYKIMLLNFYILNQLNTNEYKQGQKTKVPLDIPAGVTLCPFKN